MSDLYESPEQTPKNSKLERTQKGDSGGIIRRTIGVYAK